MMEKIRRISALKLENEMDLILAHKRSMKISELCTFSSSMQTYFATAVSEIGRISMGRKKDKQANLTLNIVSLGTHRKELTAVITFGKEELLLAKEALDYAQRLVDEVTVEEAGRKVSVTLSQRISLAGLITEQKMAELEAFFEKEAPISPYDEIRKKNIQLITLTEKLKESESDYKKLTESLPLMMFSLNAMGKVRKANEWLSQNFTDRKFIGMPWQHFLHPEDAKQVNTGWEEAQLGKTGFNAQARVKVGENLIWHLINIVPLKDKHNNISEWAGFFVDIHAQKLVEQTLKNNEDLKRVQKELLAANDELRIQRDFVETILDSSVDLIGVYDTEMRFLAFNRQCEKIYGISRKEVLGKTLHEVFPDAVDRKPFSDLKLAMSGQTVHNSHFYSPITGKHLENFLIPLRDHNGTIYGVLVIAHDITDNVLAEQKLKLANSELVKSNHDLEQFAYIASHDLQEPLRKIRNFSELLQRNLDKKEVAARYADKIDAAASRMTTLIKDVLNYAKVSTSQTPADNVDLNEILKAVKVDFELAIEESSAMIESSQLPTVKAVDRHMQQLFYNIIGNALKFRKENPKIRISSAVPDKKTVDEQGLEQDRKYVQIDFRDNGIGFDQEYAERAFTIFQRLTDKYEYEGTGIGLALCKKIVDNHKGRIFARSEIGKGTTISVILPVN